MERCVRAGILCAHIQTSGQWEREMDNNNLEEKVLLLEKGKRGILGVVFGRKGAK